MIVCGTDLSEASDAASKCAAAVAKKTGEDLRLVHVLASDEPSARASAELRLEEHAKRLRQDFGISVETRAAGGSPDEQLLNAASDSSASLLVVGVESGAARSRRLGGVAERICQAGTFPVLVVRNADGMEAWARGARALNVLVGSGLGDASRDALRQVGGWPELSLTVAHVAWPFREHQRLGIAGPMPLDQLRPEVHQQLIGDLGRWAEQTTCSSSPQLKVTPGWGRLDSHLAQLAEDEAVDLLVVGSHQRNIAERVWHGSVSRNVIHEAPCNVLCVPQGQLPTVVAPAPRVVVIPTDFSRLADRALAVGYGLLDRGGTVHLVHVLGRSEGSGEQGTTQLLARVPADAEARGVSSVMHVVESTTPWLAISQYASRVRADVICMATHGRNVASRLVLGSQAQQLLEHSRIPVLLVPRDREG